MGTHAIERGTRLSARMAAGAGRHLVWLVSGFALAFLVPFVLADLLDLPRDLYYAIYVAGVAAFFGLWVRTTGQSLGEMIRRRWVLALVLGLAVAGLLTLIVLQTEDATARPGGLELIGAVMWRGVVYGLADGLLLSAFPILAVFAMFAGTKAARANPWDDRDRPGGAAGFAGDDRRVPRRLQRLSLGEAAEAGRGRRRLEHPHARNAQPDRRTHCACRAAYECRPAQLRNRHVSPAPRLVETSMLPVLAARAAAVVMVGVAAFQLALVFGAPWGVYTQGGGTAGALDASGRVFAGVSCVILLVMAAAILARVREGPLKNTPGKLVTALAWFTAIYAAVAVVLNLSTSSSSERAVFAPTAILLLVLVLSAMVGSRHAPSTLPALATFPHSRRQCHGRVLRADGAAEAGVGRALRGQNGCFHRAPVMRDCVLVIERTALVAKSAAEYPQTRTLDSHAVAGAVRSTWSATPAYGVNVCGWGVPARRCGP